VINNLLCFAHVGDSRIYLYSQKTGLQALTKDHTIVRRLVDLGQISAKDAQSNPLRNQLYRAVGQSEAFRADLGIRELDAACTLLLCSDGLWGLVRKVLAEDAGKRAVAQATRESAVDAANKPAEQIISV
jgi:protein phosphatase